MPFRILTTLISAGALTSRYPNEVLARLDIVVAAIHSSFRHNKDEITGRLVDALANPHVDILAHPTARLIGSREPLEMDFDRVLQAALKANIALEINGSMYRLDLNDVMARAAQEAGALLAIGSDAPRRSRQAAPASYFISWTAIY